ncbi:hypothetical protein ADN00_15550 [Ornatilinea apprima]|uniref:Bacteriophage lambda Replication protein O N-terminal domain-containing protein n=1 Tax=Ornatilinea apprima TaxID=1134406 RepID=A0A0P6WT21_9CHLR|nr:helix-turn-helix domain-containing protein [Ornatilinea apprima]KPL72233.1 hypothetical protein ADN00_15550 [Ornatilinea apprima]
MDEEILNNIMEVNHHKYYFEIPNMVDDLELSPYAFRLYAHLKRVAGENGASWQSNSTLAKVCKMSAGSVVNAKRELQDAGLIVVTLETTKDNNRYHNITIVDIWANNFKKFTQNGVGRSSGEHPSSPGEHPPSPGELKNNPIKNNPVKNNPNTCAVPRRERVTAAKKQGDLLDGILSFAEKSEDPLANFPEAVKPTLKAFLDLWKIDPPRPPQRGRGGTFAQWIKEAQDLQSACRDYPLNKVLQAVYSDWLKSTYCVDHPGAILRSVRGKVIEFRAKGVQAETPKVGLENYDPAEVAEFQAKLNQARQNSSSGLSPFPGVE